MNIILVILLAVGYYVFKRLAANEEKRDYRTPPRHKDPMSEEKWAAITKKSDLSSTSPAGWKKKAEMLTNDLKALAGNNAEKKETSPFGKEKKSGRPSPVEIRKFHEQRLDEEWEQSLHRGAQERALNAGRFAAARTKQADEETIHAVHIDSCEGRLESLRVLYDAGILDREEYQQRVARVKRRHKESRA